MMRTETRRDMTESSQGSNRSSRWWLRQDSHSVMIEASAERIYALVADLPRMGEWSPECRSVDGSTVRPDPPRGPGSSATTKAALSAS